MPAPRRVRAMDLGHADIRTDWRLFLVPVLPARPSVTGRNGLPWRPWDWRAAHRANQARAEEVFAMVCDARARAAGRQPAGDGYLSADLAWDAVLEGRRGAA